VRRTLALAASALLVACGLFGLRIALAGFGAEVSDCAAFSQAALFLVSAIALAVALGTLAAAITGLRRALEGGPVLVPVAVGVVLVPAGWFAALLLGAGSSC
jgi:hypothetical protein